MGVIFCFGSSFGRVRKAQDMERLGRKIRGRVFLEE